MLTCALRVHVNMHTHGVVGVGLAGGSIPGWVGKMLFFLLRWPNLHRVSRSNNDFPHSWLRSTACCTKCAQACTTSVSRGHHSLAITSLPFTTKFCLRTIGSDCAMGKSSRTSSRARRRIWTLNYLCTGVLSSRLCSIVSSADSA